MSRGPFSNDGSPFQIIEVKLLFSENGEPYLTSAIVLAGGYSRRMGIDKALLTTSGQSHLAIIVDKLSRLSDDVTIIRRKDQTKLVTTAHVAFDIRPGEGPLAGLEVGLSQARHEYVICLSIDAPFVRIALLRYLVSLISQQERPWQAVIPMLDNHLYPMVSVYHISCLSEIQQRLDQKKRRVIDLIDNLSTRYVPQEEWEPMDPAHESFMMLNSLDDYEKVLQRLAAGGFTG